MAVESSTGHFRSSMSVNIDHVRDRSLNAAMGRVWGGNEEAAGDYSLTASVYRFIVRCIG